MGTSHKGGMLVGYARVSTEDQNLDLQKDALQKAGCEKLFTDVASQLLADGPAKEAAVVEDPNLRDVTRVVAQQDLLPDVSR